MENRIPPEAEQMPTEEKRDPWLPHAGALCYGIVLAGLALLSLLFLTSLFQAGNSIMGADDVYGILLIFIMVEILLLVVIMTPLCAIASNTAEDDAPVWARILTVWVPIVLSFAWQARIFAVCALLSPYLDVTVLKVLSDFVSLSLIILVWILLCSVSCLMAKKMQWHVVGF